MPDRGLRELDGEFRRLKVGESSAPCLEFTCPVCPNGHAIYVGYEPPSIFDNGAVWTRHGDSIDNVSLTPSVNCDIPNKDGTPSTCKFHGFVTNGRVTW